MKLLITCPFGLGSLLANELKKLWFQPFQTFSTGSFVETDLRGLYTINLWSRLANKVYLELATSKTKNFDELFAAVKNSSYGQRSANSNISIKVTTHSSILKANRAIQSISHKAILESVKNFSKAEEKSNELFLIIEHDLMSLYLNTSGASLHQRGYRTQTGLAPLKENLAVALLLLSGWNFKAPLKDPCTGAGTIAIEALLLAKNIAPGSRRSFAFEKFSRFDSHLWSELKKKAQEKEFKGNYEIFASDIDPQMIKIAKQNAKNWKLEDAINFKVEDIIQPQETTKNPMRIITNPPYGKRISSPKLKNLYQTLENLINTTGKWGIISSYPDLHPDPTQRTHKKLFNGEEACTFWYRKAQK